MAESDVPNCAVVSDTHCGSQLGLFPCHLKIPLDAGGYYEQDYALMHRMNICSNVYNAVQHWYALEGKAIHSLSENERMILRWLKDLGLMFQ